MFCVALSKVEERSELGVLGYPERLASLLVDLPPIVATLVHSVPSACSWTAASDIAVGGESVFDILQDVVLQGISAR
jgi:hypothetical protein